MLTRHLSGLARLLRPACAGAAERRAAGAAAGLSTSRAAHGLEELIPPRHKEGEAPAPTGRAWAAAELRVKSWDDLHGLWYVLLKERARLQAERLAHRAARRPMPDPHRLTKVRKSMSRIKAVMGERLREHEDAGTRAELKAFIDAL